MTFPSDQNIILTGFMGTGKTTIGRRLAQRLGRDFVDMDDQLVAHFGKEISQVFADEGEDAFRVAEAQLCQQLAQQSGLVVSTGGGALINAQSRQALAETGVLLCLTATVDAIAARLEAMNDRPMLETSTQSRRQRIQDLLQQRRPAYAAIAHHVDTSGRTPGQIVDAVLATLNGHLEAPNMTRIDVPNPEGGYQICIGEGLIGRAGQLMRNRNLRPGTAAVVTNDMIAQHYAEPLLASLRASGYEPTLCLVPEGEQYKTLATVADLYEQFLAAKLDRRSPIIALGGGVVGDMTGFAAASFLRGVPFVQIPTSLLAMVDSSVGGKTGVDLPQGKNLVGAFKQPAVVIIDTDVLSTLPAAEFRCGLAETIKHGVIGAPDLFEQIETHGPASLKHLVADAVRVKVQVVEEDPYESGRRAVLNLGHTFGQAIEPVSEFSIRHGEAVAVGMVAAANMAASLGYCSQELAERTRNVLERVGLPVSVPRGDYDLDALMQAMLFDKKRAGKTLRFIVPRALGDVTIIDNPGDEHVRAAFETVLL